MNSTNLHFAHDSSKSLIDERSPKQVKFNLAEPKDFSSHIQVKEYEEESFASSSDEEDEKINVEKEQATFNERARKLAELLKVRHYDLTDFFEDETDESKLLATISNEFSKFNSSIFGSSDNTSPRYTSDPSLPQTHLYDPLNEQDNKWYAISKMILSRLNYRMLLVKYRYLLEDINNKNFPFYYEKKSKVFDAIQEWVKDNERRKSVIQSLSPKKGGFLGRRMTIVASPTNKSLKSVIKELG